MTLEVHVHGLTNVMTKREHEFFKEKFLRMLDTKGICKDTVKVVFGSDAVHFSECVKVPCFRFFGRTEKESSRAIFSQLTELIECMENEYMILE